ncbi:T9SS type A sorting domain-containing protein [Hymenobacter gummosus]|uniref:T9SS type A sorting domain-containing protein n=1 Tax=Hymenobacter gummosus TaxID=1776032 RepID=A0A431UA30_9BACT|nr:IPT/TIG domain-containing protein [Hymenobacter gummosus]RTQ53676.1 T9SS type A sorting domain-containing protein [Hymenobacter gummosus]
MPALATIRHWRILGVLLLLAGAGRAALAQPAEPAAAHCLLLPLDAAQRARAATLVVEAEVLSQRSFWDEAHRHIYTASTLRVYKLLKGQWTAGAPLTVLTEGGTVDLARETLTNTLSLSVGQQGLLFLTPASFPGVSQPAAWAAYASQQGFIRYDVPAARAAEPFRQYPLVGPAFYQQQLELTGQPLRELAPNPALTTALARRLSPPPARRGPNGVDAPLISGLSPRNIAAGIDSVLTIDGVGFGGSRGAVEFRNADDGGASFTRALDRDVVSWSDTRIRVRVPSYSAEGRPAGTGPVRVVTADQQTATSVLPLTVRYAVSNVQETTSGTTLAAGHINQNGQGGYSFRPDAAFAGNAAALAAFGRALSSWRCQTAINWDLGSARTARGIASDDVNALEFDQGAELPGNILGRTTSYYLGCRDASGQLRFWVKEVDMQFDDAINWQFGPGLPAATQFDFETVVLHELGHAQQLGHVIAPGVAVMHFAVARAAVNRQLSFGRDVLGGYTVQLRSLAPASCGPAPEQPAPLTAPLSTRGQDGRVLLSWPTRNECNVQAFAVERSPDRQTWTRLTQLPATGAGGYSYTDAQPLGGLAYYRLQVLLTNGLALPAAPVGARAAAGGPAVAVFPNPATGPQLQLEYDAPAATNDFIVRIYDALGRYYGGQRLVVPQAGIGTLSVVLPPLKAGWYVLRWTDGGQQGTVPFVREQR